MHKLKHRESHDYSELPSTLADASAAVHCISRRRPSCRKKAVQCPPYLHRQPPFQALQPVDSRCAANIALPLVHHSISSHLEDILHIIRAAPARSTHQRRPTLHPPGIPLPPRTYFFLFKVPTLEPRTEPREPPLRTSGGNDSCSSQGFPSRRPTLSRAKTCSHPLLSSLLRLWIRWLGRAPVSLAPARHSPPP